MEKPGIGVELEGIHGAQDMKHLPGCFPGIPSGLISLNRGFYFLACNPLKAESSKLRPIMP